MFVLICHVYCSMSQMMMMMAMMMRAGRQHYSLTTTTDWYLWHCHTLPGQPVVAMVLARAGAGGQAAMAPAARLQLQPLVVLVKLCHSAFTSHTTSGRTVFSLVHRSIYWAFYNFYHFCCVIVIKFYCQDLVLFSNLSENFLNFLVQSK